MRTPLLAGTSLMAITAVAGSTLAMTIDYAGKVETDTVPQTAPTASRPSGRAAAPRRMGFSLQVAFGPSVQLVGRDLHLGPLTVEAA